MSWAEGIQLQRPVPTFYDLLRSLAELLGRALDPIPPIGVGLDPVPYGSAEQVVDGLVECLADDIPTSRLEHRDAAAHHLAGTREVVAAHLLDQLLYPERVVPDEVPRGSLGQVPDQASVWLAILASPRPVNPSSVWARTMVRLRHSVPTTNVSTWVIFMPSPLTRRRREGLGKARKAGKFQPLGSSARAFPVRFWRA